jgi:phage terminase small subunit
MLNVRQEQFCIEYMKCGNATEAMVKAGYSEKYAGQNVDKLLKNTNVQARLAELSAEVKNENIADVQEMQEVLTSIIRQYTTEEMLFATPTGIERTTKTASIRDIVNAINTLGKLQGAFVNTVDLRGVVPVVIKDDVDEEDD